MRTLKRFAAVMLCLAGMAGCAAVRMPPVDLSNPQWRVRRGQALWKLPSGKLEITGDLVVAQNHAGDVWVSMTKALLPIFTARTWNNTWSIDFVQRGQSHQGHGRPPYRRFIWLYLPKMLAGAPPPGYWRLTRKKGSVHLENPRTGEQIKVVFE